MSNQKSDEMVKSLVAQIASQFVAIFIQTKKEKHDTQNFYEEMSDELRMRLEDLEDPLVQTSNVIIKKDEKISEYVARLEEATKKAEKFKRWWLEVSKDFRIAQKELNSLKGGPEERTLEDDLERKEIPCA